MGAGRSAREPYVITYLKRERLSIVFFFSPFLFLLSFFFLLSLFVFSRALGAITTTTTTTYTTTMNKMRDAVWGFGCWKHCLGIRRHHLPEGREASYRTHRANVFTGLGLLHVALYPYLNLLNSMIEMWNAAWGLGRGALSLGTLRHHLPKRGQT